MSKQPEHQTDHLTNDNSLSNNEIQNIYSKLCINEDEDSFESKELTLFLENCIEQCFDICFRKLSTTIIESNGVLINNSFVKLIKFCESEYCYKNVGLIFIAFCDYFDLSYNKIYLQLHEKLQNLIIMTAKCICSASYEKNNKKRTNSGIVTLFDLVNNKDK